MTEIKQLETPSGLIVTHLKSEKVPAGHVYDVDVLDNSESELRTLAAIRFQNGPIRDVGINGITNEDLLVILIHRTETVNEQFPCEENEAAIEFMRNALDAFNARVANRKARGVADTMVK